MKDLKTLIIGILLLGFAGSITVFADDFLDWEITTRLRQEQQQKEAERLHRERMRHENALVQQQMEQQRRLQNQRLWRNRSYIQTPSPQQPIVINNSNPQIEAAIRRLFTNHREMTKKIELLESKLQRLEKGLRLNRTVNMAQHDRLLNHQKKLDRLYKNELRNLREKE